MGVGRYRFTEVKAPDGYLILNNHVYFEVYKDNQDSKLKARLIDERGNVIASQTTDQATITTEGSGDTTVFTIAVKNIPGNELPRTGGIGTTAIYATGALLVGIAGFGLVSKKRRNTL